MKGAAGAPTERHLLKSCFPILNDGKHIDVTPQKKSYQHPLFGGQPTYSLALDGTLQALAETGA